LDFHCIKKIVDEILDKLDHTTLPDGIETAEKLAKYIKCEITRSFEPRREIMVEVWETDKFGVRV